MTLDNNLVVTFNDTIVHKTITKDDLDIKIYGPETNYNFTWSAEFTQSKEMMIYMSIVSPIIGGRIEQVRVEFIKPSKFISSVSKKPISSGKKYTHT